MPPRARKSAVQSDRVGKKGVIVWLEESDKRALKVAAAQLDTTMQEIMIRAVRAFLDKHRRQG